MGKVNVKIVVGANYGDEGKGLATDFFARNASGKCLNVLYNGGPQRGHTVELKGGKRHVFHHFGSGTFANAHTLFDKDFMVNPILFAKEYDELARDGVDVKCFVSPDCRVTTPYDMIINQIVEMLLGIPFQHLAVEVKQSRFLRIRSLPEWVDILSQPLHLLLVGHPFTQ